LAGTPDTLPGVSKKLDKKRARREAEQRRREQLRRQARRRNLLTIGVAVVVLLGVAGLVWAQRASEPTKPAGLREADPLNVPTNLPGLMTGKPPWPADNGPSLGGRLDDLGFPKGQMETLDFHIHQHLDIYVHGSPVAVPANIGIDANGQYLTVLHTHSEDGIIHVESPLHKDYSLAQFFAVWGLRLTPDCIGGLCDDGPNKLTAYENGKRVDNPRNIILNPHDEIVLAYGTPSELPKPIPSKYDFPAGD
jgi:hypothetical protein